MTEAYREGDTILVRGPRTRRLPLTLENCFALRKEYGRDLQVHTDLATWAKAQIDDRMAALESFRTMSDALPLFPHQRTARDHLLNNPRGALFLDMGLGKTLSTLAALTPEHLPVLVVAPKRVAEHVWPDEIRRWRPDLTFALAAGDAPKRRKALAAGADITIIGRDNLRDVTPGYRTVVLDELSSFKNRSTVRWKAARTLTQAARFVWGLTGTPAPNGYIDLWAEIALLDGGARLGRTLTSYRNTYFRPGLTGPQGVVYEWKILNDSAETINTLLSDICISMDAEYDFDVRVNPVAVDLPAAEARTYRTMAQELVVELGDEVYTAANAAVLSGKLSQLTAGFLYTDEHDGTYTWLHNAKLDALEEIAEGTGDNLLVFYRYKAERDQIMARFPQAVGIDDRGALDAWNRGEVRMLVAHPASAGHGLNLQHGGHTIVWTTVDWSLELWEQANARLARQGQLNGVVIHVIEATDSVDTFIRRTLDGKAFTQDGLRDYLKATS